MCLYAYRYLLSKFSIQQDEDLVPHINVSFVKSATYIAVLHSATVYL
jgi:hypothetical protein